MSDNKIAQALSKEAKKSLIKWVLIGATLAILLSSIIAAPLILDWFEEDPKEIVDDDPNDDPDDNFTIKLAESVQASFPEIIKVGFLGNGTSGINDRLLTAYATRSGEASEAFTWNVSAQVITDPRPIDWSDITVEEMNFTFTNEEVMQVAQSTYDAIALTNETERPNEFPSVYFGLEFFYENHTAIQLLLIPGEFIIVGKGTWETLDYTSVNLMEAYVLEPASAFDEITTTLQALFAPHLPE
jgi:hypothetical protein